MKIEAPLVDDGGLERVGSEIERQTEHHIKEEWGGRAFGIPQPSRGRKSINPSKTGGLGVWYAQHHFILFGDEVPPMRNLYISPQVGLFHTGHCKGARFLEQGGPLWSGHLLPRRIESKNGNNFDLKDRSRREFAKKNLLPKSTEYSV